MQTVRGALAQVRLARRLSAEGGGMSAHDGEHDAAWADGFESRWDQKVREVEAEAAVASVKEITEDAIAKAFIDANAGHRLYCHTGQPQWFYWNHTHWQADETRQVFDELREFTRAACARVSKKEGRAGGGARFCSGAEKFCQADRRVAITADRFDQHDWLLGTPGGVVDLRTGEIHPARPDDYITRQTAVAPAPPGTPCPQWSRFIEEATGGDAELAGFLKRYAGYALTGLTNEQCLLFVSGLGGNGKGVFTNTLRRIVGTYATVAAMTTFVSRAYDAHPEELASLAGARLVTASETEEGRKWDEVKIKQLTGGDTIRSRFMGKNSFTYRPAFKLLFIGNSTPNLGHLDDAWRRRFHLAEFNHKPAIPDTNLESNLEAEWPAILEWCIQGCLEWQESGLRPPASVVETTKRYFEEQDVFGTWLRERCEVEPGNPYKKESSAKLFESWTAFARSRQHEPGTMKGFGRDMNRHSLHSKQIKIFNGKGYEGIKLKNSVAWEER
jgi:putative DNA primase/helicase